MYQNLLEQVTSSQGGWTIVTKLLRLVGAAIPFLTILHAAIQQYQHGITLDDVYDIYDEFVDEGHNITDLVPIIYEVFKVSGYCGQAEEAKESEAKNA